MAMALDLIRMKFGSPKVQSLRSTVAMFFLQAPTSNWALRPLKKFVHLGADLARELAKAWRPACSVPLFDGAMHHREGIQDEN